MERSLGEIRVTKRARFMVEQRVQKTWSPRTAVTFSKAFIAELWKISISTGIFIVPKTATYAFVWSGTAGKPDASISMYLKNSSGTAKIETFLETVLGRFKLTEGTKQQYIDYR